MTNIQLIDSDEVINVDIRYEDVEKILDKLIGRGIKIGKGRETSYLLSNKVAIMVDYSKWYSEYGQYWHGIIKEKFQNYINKYGDKFYIILKCQYSGIFPIPGKIFMDWCRNLNMIDGSWKFVIIPEEEKVIIRELGIDISEYRNKIDVLENKEIGHIKPCENIRWGNKIICKDDPDGIRRISRDFTDISISSWILDNKDYWNGNYKQSMISMLNIFYDRHSKEFSELYPHGPRGAKYIVDAQDIEEFTNKGQYAVQISNSNLYVETCLCNNDFAELTLAVARSLGYGSDRFRIIDMTDINKIDQVETDIEIGKVEESEKDIIKKKCRDLHFEEKILIASEIPWENNYNVAALCGLKKLFPNIYRSGDSVVVVDCETGKRYNTHIHPGRDDLINAGLRDLWNENDRYKKFHDGDVIGLALDPGDNHVLYVCFRYQEKRNDIDTEKQPVIDNSEKTDTEKQPIDINMYIDKFIDNNIIDLETPDSILDEEKEEIRHLITKDRHKIVSLVNESLRPIIKDYHSKIVADKERKEQEAERIKLEEDKKRKEEQRKKNIEKKRENLYNTDIGKLILEAKNCNLYGPSGTSKTTLAQKTAGEIIGIYVEGETDNIYKEFKDKGYIIFVRVHPSYDYGRFIERKTFHTEKEGEPTLDKKFISLPGDLKIASKKALLLATGHDIDDKYNWSDVYNEYILLTDEQKKEIFEYAPAIVLIIDELNRGNIQEILGEFGTMMEKDKRLGEENEVTVILKSGDIFGIPPNLYIISTMNTVDTSIVGIDVATMRRFNSIRCIPNFKIVEDYIDIARENELISEDLLNRIDNVKAALEKINGRIRSDNELGLYRQIGHTYILDNKSKSKLVDTVSKLIMAWNNKIFPAIEIICRYDYDKITEILFNEDKITELLFDDSSDKSLQPFDIEKLDNIIEKINGSD